MEFVEKIIIPAAGLGSRFYPITKALPKEMLPIFNKPAIEYIIQEALDSCAQQLILIINDKKKVLQHYLEHLHTNLTLNSTQLHYVQQNKPLGLGDAVLKARSLIQKEYFGIMLPDDLFITSNGVFKDLVKNAQLHKASIIGVQQVPAYATCSYGIVSIKEQVSQHLYAIDHIVEKPPLGTAPSNLAIVGRYVLSSILFDYLATTSAGRNGEIQLSDGIDAFIKSGHPVYAYSIPEYRYDIGTPAGWFDALLHYALQKPEYAEIVRKRTHISLTGSSFDTSSL